MSARKKSSIRSKQPPDLFAETLAKYQALEKRYVIALPRCPASHLPRAKAELRQVRRVIRSVRQASAEHQAIVRQLRSSS